MKTLRTIVVVSTAVLAALWWAVMPPEDKLVIAAPVAVTQALQCPAGSRVEQKECVCPAGQMWDGSACAFVGPLPDTRHVTTVDLRHR
jgi:hypothetical protein